MGQTRTDSNKGQVSHKFITMDIDDIGKYYKVMSVQNVPLDLRTKEQKELLKGFRTRRITLARKDFDYEDIKRVKGQKKIPKNQLINGPSSSNKDYESWLSVRSEL